MTDTPPIPNRLSYVTMAVWVTILGVLLMVAPHNWYGPSWSYFAHHGGIVLPAGGFGMGLCLTSIGALQLLTLWRNHSRWLPALFFLAGFVLWTSGILLAAEGLLGHQGLMEAPFMVILGAHKFVTSSVIRAELHRRKHGQP